MFHVRAHSAEKTQHSLLCHSDHVDFLIVAFVTLLDCESMGLFGRHRSKMNSSPACLQSYFKMTAALLVYINPSGGAEKLSCWINVIAVMTQRNFEPNCFCLVVVELQDLKVDLRGER